METETPTTTTTRPRSKFARNIKLTGIFVGGTFAFLILMGALSALQPLIFAIGMGMPL